MALQFRPLPLAVFTALALIVTAYFLRSSFSPLPIHDALNASPSTIFNSPSGEAHDPASSNVPYPSSPSKSDESGAEVYKPKHPIYKPSPSSKLPIPIIDNFPLAQYAQSAADLPSIPSWNSPPSPHVQEKTPLLIGFTRNWRILQQCVVSYITAGWPPEDIYVVENTGVMESNTHGLLSLQNPFFLNHTRLELLVVNILVTPTLFTFAQLQNFYLWTAIENEWSHYFWSHMDVLDLSWEDGGIGRDDSPHAEEKFQSLYQRALMY